MVDVKDTPGEDTPSVDLAGQQDGSSAPEGNIQPSPAEEKTFTLTEAQLTELGDMYADKKHAKLDTRIHELTTESEGLRQTIGDLEGQIGQGKATELASQEKAEFDAAESEAEQARIRQKYADIRKTEELAAEHKRLEGEISSKKDVLERMNEEGRANYAKQLAEEFAGVSAEFILKHFTGDDPEKMKEFAEETYRMIPGAPALPPPGGLTTVPSGQSFDGKTPIEIAEQAYAKK